jgi:alcohol dehydrogenase class IV
LDGVKTLSIAKAAAMAATGSLDIDSIIDGRKPDSAGIPFVAVPTTMRDPYLLCNGIYLSDARDRSAKTIGAQADITRAVIMDPKLSASMSGKACCLAVLELLMEAVEGFTSAKANFFSDTVLERAIFLLFKSLDALIARPDDPQARFDAVQASFLTALGVSASSLGLGTGTVLSLNARYELPKSSLSAILVPYVMEEAAKSRVEKVAIVAAAAGEEWEGDSASEGARKAIEAIRQRLGAMKVPTRLKDFDLELDPLAALAQTARSLEMMSYLPRRISADDIYDLMRQAY